MNHNELKKYTVKVGSGSGCVFQPMDEKHTYILSAKHLFQTEELEGRDRKYLEDGSEIFITFQLYNEDEWSENETSFIFQMGVNFFPHENILVDAAILKIPQMEGYDNIFISKKETIGDFYLCGFPGRLDDEDEPANGYTPYIIEDFLDSGNYFNKAKLDGILNFEEVQGTSGGGILSFNDKSIFILGIQSRMANNAEYQNGEIGYVPIRYYEQIITKYNAEGELQDLLPVFLNSFISLIGSTFQMGIAPLYSEEEALSELLKTKAELLRTSDLTPIEIKNFLGDRCLLIKNQSNVELKRKRIWTLWLELLVILNIAKEKVHKVEDLNDLMKRIRFFYSDTEDDFLGTHLQDLWKIDYSDLEEGGLVIFSSNQKYQNEKTKGILDFCEILPSIVSSAKREFEREQNIMAGVDGIYINQTVKFPFEKYKYASLTTFKEDAALKLDSSFVEMDSENCYLLLKELYEGLLS